MPKSSQTPKKPKTPASSSKGKAKETNPAINDAGTSHETEKQLKRRMQQDADDALALKRRFLESYRAEPTPFPERLPVTIKNEPGTSPASAAKSHVTATDGRAPSHVDPGHRAGSAHRPSFVQDIFDSDFVHRRHFEGAMEHVNMQFDPRFAESNAMSQLGNWLDLNKAQMEAGHPGLVEDILRHSLEGRFGAMCDFFTRLRDDVAGAIGRDLLVLDLPTLRMARLQMGIAHDQTAQRPLITPPHSVASQARTAPQLVAHSTEDAEVSDSEPGRAAHAALHDSGDAPANPAPGHPTNGTSAHDKLGGDASNDEESTSSSGDDTDPSAAPVQPTVAAEMKQPKSKPQRKPTPKPVKREPSTAAPDAPGTPHIKSAPVFENTSDLYLHTARLCMAEAALVTPTDQQAQAIFRQLTSAERTSWRQLWQLIRAGKGKVDDGRDILEAQGLVRRLQKWAVVHPAAMSSKDRKEPTEASSIPTETPTSSPQHAGLRAFPSFFRATMSTPSTQPCLVPRPSRPHGSSDDRFMLLVLDTPCTPIAMPSKDDMTRACTRAFGAGHLRTVTKHDDNTWIITMDNEGTVHRACVSGAQVSVAGRSVEVEYLSRAPRVFVAEITGLGLKNSAIKKGIGQAFAACANKPTLWSLKKDGRRQLMLRFSPEWAQPPPVHRWYIPLRTVVGDGEEERVHAVVFKPRSIKDACLFCGEGHRSGSKDCGKQVAMELKD